MYRSASFFRRSPLALGRWLPTFRAMAISSPLKNSHSRSISRRMPAHVGAGVPANRNKHRGLSPRSYDFTEAERVRYDTFGNRTVLAPDGITTRAVSSYNQQVGFTGRYLDKETGLWYYRTRMYSVTLGRFIDRMPWMHLKSEFSNIIISNYAIDLVDSEFRMYHEQAIKEGLYSYIQNRFNLYDYAGNDPANYMEPYSTKRMDASMGDGTGGGKKGLSMPAPNQADIMGLVDFILGEPDPIPMDPPTGDFIEDFGKITEWGMRNFPFQCGVKRICAVGVAKGASPIWKKLQTKKGKTKTDGNRLYEWDHTHGDIEVYDKRGNHLGSMDPCTGAMTKPPVKGRYITP